jgi:threonine/homoserine/homoserine lactone efflux protein
MFIVGRALAVGRPAAIAAAAGNTLGTVCQGVLAVFGLGALISGSPLICTAVEVGGALYLVKMGLTMLRHREFSTAGDASQASGHGRRHARQGFLVGVTNPKVLLFFAAVLPQFIDRSRGYVMAQMLMLLAIYGVLSLLADTSWGFAGGSIRAWSAGSPRRLELLVGGGGICIIAVGLALALPHALG